MSKPGSTFADLRHDIFKMPDLVIVENSLDVHNVAVCNLCSRCPLVMLGTPPKWHWSAPYRARVVRDLREV